MYYGGDMGAIKYPHKYFEDEVREGFYITGELKRIWAAQMEVLSEIDKVCKRHNIKWFADCGTLIGAVRHKGYVPWDDDLDICMLRDDYERFNKYAEEELPEGYVVLNLRKEMVYYEYLTRVTTGAKLQFDYEYLEKYHDCHYPIGIDIFPLDYVSPDDEKEEERKKIALNVATYADIVDENDASCEENQDYKELVKSVEELCNIKIDETLPIKQRLYMATEALYVIFPASEAKEVVLMTYWIQHNNHKYPIEAFRESIMMPFELMELPVPIEYDKVLRIEYGDYMKPVKAGGVHEYPYFEKMENFMIDRTDNYYLRYKFSKDDLNKEERNNNETIKKQVKAFIDTAKEAHDAIIVMLSQDKPDIVCELLAACQESAINIGNLIESVYGEGFAAVSILEEYCESVYQLSMAIAQREFGSEDVVGVSTFLGDIYGRMAQILNEQIINKKEMVFMPYRADYWDSMESVWREAVSKGEYDVYVVPVPYYNKTARFEITDMYYEGNDFPEYVEVTDYKSYNFEKRHPDIIVTQNPFDECNYVMSLGIEHYSRNLKKYTDELIYISPYNVDEIGIDKSSKAWKTLDYFCAVPGVVHADKVYVQSERMRETYIERLTDMSGEDYRKTWEEKIYVFDKKAVDDNRDKTIEGLPDSWRKIIYKPDGSLKKIVLYNVGIAYMAQYGEKVIDKIDNTLGIFEQNKDDVALIWYANPHLSKTLKRVDLRLRDKYNKIVDKYKTEAWGIYDESTDYKDLVDVCDAFYGDPGNMPHICRLKKKPAMIESIDILN